VTDRKWLNDVAALGGYRVLTDLTAPKAGAVERLEPFSTPPELHIPRRLRQVIEDNCDGVPQAVHEVIRRIDRDRDRDREESEAARLFLEHLNEVYNAAKAPILRRCANCGQLFIAPRTRPDSKTCSGGCRKAHWRRRRDLADQARQGWQIVLKAMAESPDQVSEKLADATRLHLSGLDSKNPSVLHSELRDPKQSPQEVLPELLPLVIPHTSGELNVEFLTRQLEQLDEHRGTLDEIWELYFDETGQYGYVENPESSTKTGRSKK